MKRTSLVLVLLWTLVAPLRGQTPQTVTPTPNPTPTPSTVRQDDDDVVRITTNLVQVDVTITDGKGQPVSDLQPEDVEIYEDGKLQKIANFSYIALTPEASSTPLAAPGAKDKNAPPAPPVRLRPEQVQRTIALVVDDLGLSWESTYYVREALKKFVDKQMQPGDLVAIIRTAGGIGALQQFTSDKRQLYAAIERIKWYPLGRGGISAFAAIENDPLAQAQEEADKAQGGSPNEESATLRNAGNRDAKAELDEFRSDIFAVGTLGALNFIVRGLRELPGRKSVMLISDGFSISSGDGQQNDRVLTALRRLTDLANRSSVVVYTMDARGLQTLGLTAADDVSGLTSDKIEQKLSDRRDQLFDTQAGLQYLAQQTGGFAVRNSNDLNGGIKRVLDDQRGYYLVGYRPDEATFDPATGRRTYHKISVKLKRPGLKVRTRTGFYGVSDEKAVPAPRTREAQLNAAVTSPFGANGVHLRLTSFFGNDAKVGSFIRSLLHIDARDLTFVKQPDGTHQAVFDVLAYTFGDNGQPIDNVGRTYTLTVKEKLETLRRDGFVYTLTVPLKKAGAYQLRVALRDTATERVGAASQFVEVPNFNKNRLALSSLALSNDDSQTPENAAKGADEARDPQTTVALRRFQAGQAISYGYWIYNAKPDKATQRPQLTSQARIFYEGKEIYAGPVHPYDIVATGANPDLRRIVNGGRLQLGTKMNPGEYILQVIVTDLLASGKNRTTSQWIDFEIVK